MKKSKTPKNLREGAIGVAWYREIDWPRVKASFPDAEELHDTYAEWRDSAESVIRHLAQSGIAAQPVTFDIDHFIGWCSAHGHSLNAEARAAYVAEMLELKRQAQEFRAGSSSI